VRELTDLTEVVESAYGCSAVRTCSIGGSGTWALDRAPGRGGFPEELSFVAGDAVVGKIPHIPTPFGTIPLVKVLDVCGQPVLRIPVHGWHFPVPDLDDTLAVFWLLSQMGVEQIVVDASVGGLSARPWDLVIPDDVFVDSTAKLAVSRLAGELGRSAWVRMKDPFCQRIRRSLADSARRLPLDDAGKGLHPFGRLVEGGTYLTTPLSVFETASEIAAMVGLGATVVGQSSGQEVACARLCRMCFAVANPVANLGEGLEAGAWVDGGMDRFYDELALPMATVVWWTLERIVAQERSCDCLLLADSVDLQRYIGGRG
jgi:purine nucleoside phosphorylase